MPESTSPLPAVAIPRIAGKIEIQVFFLVCDYGAGIFQHTGAPLLSANSKAAAAGSSFK